MNKLLLISLFILNSSLSYAVQEVPYDENRSGLINSFYFNVTTESFLKDRPNAIKPCVGAAIGVEYSLQSLKTKVVLLDDRDLFQKFGVDEKNSWIISRSTSYVYEIISNYMSSITYSINAFTYGNNTDIQCIISGADI